LSSFLRAMRLRDSGHTVEEFTDRLADMKAQIRDREDEFNIESPNQLRGTLVDETLDGDEEDSRREIAREWEHLQRRIEIVGFATGNFAVPSEVWIRGEPGQQSYVCSLLYLMTPAMIRGSRRLSETPSEARRLSEYFSLSMPNPVAWNTRPQWKGSASASARRAPGRRSYSCVPVRNWSPSSSAATRPSRCNWPWRTSRSSGR